MIDPLVEIQNPDELKLSIPFTQYLKPDGRKRMMRFGVLGESAVAARKVLDAGLQFECEILTTDEVSLTVFDDEIEEDIAIEVCPNGPDVDAAIVRLINAAVEYIADKEAEGE